MFPPTLQRKCDCGAPRQVAGDPCEQCAGKAAPVQRKLAIGSVNDPLERVPAATPAPSAVAPASVHRTLGSSGRPLDGPVRHEMEQRFGHDFSHVRIHSDGGAAQSARDVGALAYTVGSDIVFGAGQYSPRTNAGRFTLAHELAHVVQQQGSEGRVARRALGSGPIPIGHADDGEEREADRAAEAALRAPEGAAAVELASDGGTVLRRRLVINPADVVPLPGGAAGPPQLLTNAVSGLLSDTCPNGGFNVDAGTGLVTDAGGMCSTRWYLLNYRWADVSSTAVGCGCICDVIAEAKTTTVEFTAGGPYAEPTSAAPPGIMPGTLGHPSDATVHIDPRFQGQYRINGVWTDVPFHLLFAHELCGHARPLMRGTQVPPGAGPPGGTPPHEVYSVGIERQVAAEHNPPLPQRPSDYSGAAREKP